METLDYSVIALFLMLTLGVGALAGRRITDIKAFAVGSRHYGTFALFATLSASYIGGGYTFGLTEKTFESGISYILCLLGFSLQLFLVALFLAPKMRRFKDAYSVGDIMEKLYGRRAKLITGLASALVCSGIIGAQVKATGFVFKLFLGIDPTIGILLGCGIVIAYAVYGGMRAVIATDILQFSVLVIAIPLTLYFGIKHVGGVDALISTLPAQHLEIPGALGIATLVSLFLSLLLGEAMVPPYVQRLFIARDTKTTARGTLLSSLLSVPFFVISGAIGLIALSLNGDLNPNMSLPFVISTVLPAGLKGLAVAGIVACIMSSADSFLNAAAIAIVNDLIKPLRKAKLNGTQELSLTRLLTLFIGVLAIVFALSMDSALDILLYSYNFWSPIILLPLCLGIIGVKASSRDFLVAAGSGVIAVIVWNIFWAEQTGFDGLVIGVFANLLGFMISRRVPNKRISHVS